ncbi:hypothetical protein [Pseudomonas sp. 22 E 5]|nr:hypothetical protein [Pseudomonas sp. 22 E 5]
MVGIAQIEELYFEIAPVQGQQPNGILRHFGQAYRFILILMGAGVGEAHQRLHDARNALGLFENLPADLGDFAVFLALFPQILRKAGDTGDRVADFMGHARRQSANAGQPLGVHQLVFEHLGFGQVFYQQHQAAVTGRQGFVDGGFVQVEPTGLAVEGQVLLVQMFVGQVDEALQQFFPRVAQGIEA